MQKKSASSVLSAKSQNRAGSNLWESVKSVGLINSKEENLRHLRNPRDLSSPSRASRKEDSKRLPPVFKSPEEMPSPEDRLT